MAKLAAALMMKSLSVYSQLQDLKIHVLLKYIYTIKTSSESESSSAENFLNISDNHFRTTCVRALQLPFKAQFESESLLSEERRRAK